VGSLPASSYTALHNALCSSHMTGDAQALLEKSEPSNLLGFSCTDNQAELVALVLRILKLATAHAVFARSWGLKTLVCRACQHGASLVGKLPTERSFAKAQELLDKSCGTKSLLSLISAPAGIRSANFCTCPNFAHAHIVFEPSCGLKSCSFAIA